MTLEERVKNRKLKTAEDWGLYSSPKLFVLLPNRDRAIRNVTFHFNRQDIQLSYISYIVKNKNYSLYLYKPNSEKSDAILVKGCYGYEVISGGYGRAKGFHNLLYMHRLIYHAFYEEHNEMLQIHHMDGNKSNNAIDNLVALTSTEHTELHKHTTVVPNSRRKLW